jgi:tRNA pseudouridine13 synthase
MTHAIALAWGAPVARGSVAAEPDDFDVTEEMGFAPDGEGQHLWLWVEKRGRNTGDVAWEVAQLLQRPPSAVGFAGRKDRWATTRQWLSVDFAGAPEPALSRLVGDGWWVTQARRHRRKLRRGSHRANRFQLRIRGVHGERKRIDARLGALAAAGFPNYFGYQRFGRGFANLERARRAIDRARPRRPPEMALSAARAWLFNVVLAERVEAGTWPVPQVGEAVMLDGTRSLFCHDGTDAGVGERAAALDLHPTGPLWGRGRVAVDSGFAARERAWLDHEAALRDGLEALGVQADRRALRVRPDGLDWRWQGADVWIAFGLPRGAYATALLAEVFELA